MTAIKPEHWGPTRAESGRLRVISCQNCDYAHLEPLPSPDTVERYYRRDLFYTGHSPPDWLVREAEEHKRGLWNAAYRYQARLLKAGGNKNLLDWGSGGGHFLKFWTERIPSGIGVGVEPSKSARTVEASSRYTVFSAPHQIGKGFRGHARLSLLLEHVPNPLEFLRTEVIPRLGEGGRVMVIVPNEFNPLQKRMKDSWFVSNVHLNYFTPGSLRRLLRRAGLRVIFEGATFPMELFLQVGLDYRSNDKLGQRLHRLRLYWEKAVGVGAFGLYQKLYRRWGIGRELIFVAEKEKTVQ